jgi:hypothetical protein
MSPQIYHHDCATAATAPKTRDSLLPHGRPQPCPFDASHGAWQGALFLGQGRGKPRRYRRLDRPRRFNPRTAVMITEGLR